VKTEGFFLIAKQHGSGGNDKERLFFLKSEWLSYFEITDEYYNTGLSQVTDYIRKVCKVCAGVDGRQDNGVFEMLYADDILNVTDPNTNVTTGVVPNTLSTVVDLPPPPAGTTYLAQMISPPAPGTSGFTAAKCRRG
jgi:hypothetical protein